VGGSPGQLIALRQSAEATRRAQQRLRRRAQQGQSTASAEALEFAAYFLVWTTLSAAFPAAAILDLYRLRWQIELVFKRMKSILGLGHLPKKDPLSAKAWLEGKLFTGLLIERMVRSAENIFPPGAMPWQARRSRWREVEFMYRQVGAALLLPQSLATVLRQWRAITRGLAEPPRGDADTVRLG